MMYGLLKRIFLNKFWIVIINLFLSALLGYQAVFIGLNSYKPLNTSSPQQASTNTNTTSTETTALNVSPLLEAKLFGDAQPTSSNNAAARTGQIPPDTKLSLKLLGVYYSSDTSEALAMISTAENKSGMYHVGKTVSNGAVLSEVYPKYVILQRGDRYETLRLVGTANTAQLAAPNPIPATNAFTADLAPGKLLGNIQKQLVSNPEVLAKLLRIDPANENGKFVGFKLSAGQDPSIMTRFELQAGDILTGVNGVVLDSPLKGLNIVQQLSTANQVNLQIMRNGQLRSLSFNVEK